MERVYRIRSNQGAGSFVTPTLDEDALNGCAGIGEASIGDSFTITVTEMSKEDLDALPEFDGF